MLALKIRNPIVVYAWKVKAQLCDSIRLAVGTASVHEGLEREMSAVYPAGLFRKLVQFDNAGVPSSAKRARRLRTRGKDRPLLVMPGEQYI